MVVQPARTAPKAKMARELVNIRFIGTSPPAIKGAARGATHDLVWSPGTIVLIFIVLSIVLAARRGRHEKP
jgi:hypothetical protein